MNDVSLANVMAEKGIVDIQDCFTQACENKQ